MLRFDGQNQSTKKWQTKPQNLWLLASKMMWSPRQDRRQHYRNHKPGSHHFVCQLKYLRFLFPLFASILRQFEVNIIREVQYSTNTNLVLELQSECWNTLSSQMTVRASSLRRPHAELSRSSRDTNFGAPRLFELPPEWPNIFFSATSTTKDFSWAVFRRENLKVAATGSTCLSHLKCWWWFVNYRVVPDL